MAPLPPPQAPNKDEGAGVFDYEWTREKAAARQLPPLAVRTTAPETARVLRGMEFPFFCISWYIRLSTACVERMHAQNRILTLSGASSYSTTSALSLLVPYARI